MNTVFVKYKFEILRWRKSIRPFTFIEFYSTSDAIYFYEYPILLNKTTARASWKTFLFNEAFLQFISSYNAYVIVIYYDCHAKLWSFGDRCSSFQSSTLPARAVRSRERHHRQTTQTRLQGIHLTLRALHIITAIKISYHIRAPETILHLLPPPGCPNKYSPLWCAPQLHTTLCRRCRNWSLNIFQYTSTWGFPIDT
jgi:hypothetical protein